MSALFWLIALAMVALALFLLLPPLLREGGAAGDRAALNLELYRARCGELQAEVEAGTLAPESLAAAETELKRELLIATEGEEAAPARVAPAWAAWAVGLALPFAALLGYVTLGNPALIGLPAEHARVADDSAKPADEQTNEMEKLVEKLALRLRDQPDDAEGWALLGRSLSVLDRHAQAAKAFSRARQLAGDTADLLIEEGQAIAMTQAGRLAGEPMERIRRAGELDPGNVDVLWFTGLDALQRGEAQSAVNTWEELLSKLPEKSEGRSTVENAIAQARGQIGAARPGPEAALPRNVTVQVAIDPAVAAKAGPEDAVFVIARVPGMRMPLAVVRVKVSELPRQVVLDEKSAMGGPPLASFDEIEVVARVSKSGEPTARSGDLEGTTHAHVGGAAAVAIGRVVP